MRALKITRKVLVIVACCLAAATLVLPFVLGEGAGVWALFGQGYYFGVVAAAITLVAGSMMLFSKNEVAKIFGIAFTVACYAVLLGAFFVSDGSLAFLVGFVSAIVYAVSWLFALIVYAVGHAKHDDSDPNSDARIEAILKWRALLDKKIITEEEFMEKRNRILEIEPKEEPEVK